MYVNSYFGLVWETKSEFLTSSRTHIGLIWFYDTCKSHRFSDLNLPLHMLLSLHLSTFGYFCSFGCYNSHDERGIIQCSLLSHKVNFITFNVWPTFHCGGAMLHLVNSKMLKCPEVLENPNPIRDPDRDDVMFVHVSPVTTCKDLENWV